MYRKSFFMSPLLSQIDSVDFDADVTDFEVSLEQESAHTDNFIKAKYSQEVEELFMHLPWMEFLVNDSRLGTNETECDKTPCNVPTSNMIKINDKFYDLGNNQTVYDKKPCSVTGTGTNGTCTLLFHCPSVYSKIPHLQMFENYFCPLDTYVFFIF